MASNREINKARNPRSLSGFTQGSGGKGSINIWSICSSNSNQDSWHNQKGRKCKGYGLTIIG